MTIVLMKGINTAGLGFEKPALHPPPLAAFRGVLNPSLARSCPCIAYMRMVAISLRSSISDALMVGVVITITVLGVDWRERH